MTARNVLAKRAPLGKEAAKEAMALTLARLVQAHGRGAVADHAGCCETTIRNAMGLGTLPELHTVLNLLTLDPSALDELLAWLGYRLVPIDEPAAGYPALLADLAGVTAVTAAALSDGRVDHREEAQIVAQLRPLAIELNNAVARHDAKRVRA